MEFRNFLRRIVLCAVSLMIVFLMSATVWAGEIHTREDTPSDFNAFLASCTIMEKLALLGALNEKTPESPSDYDSAIRKGLVYRAYSKATYLFRDDKNVDYHGIVKWVAEELKIEGNIDRLSTFELERKILEKTSEEKGIDLSSVVLTASTHGAVFAISSVIMPLPTPDFGVIWGMLAPDVKDVTTFIMAVHMIKIEKY